MASKLTAAEKEAYRRAISIPTSIQTQILPKTNISIHEFCKYTLPPVQATVSTSPADALSFYSKSPPALANADLLRKIKYLPIPSPSVIQAVRDAAKKAWLDGYTSVRYIHLDDTATTCFPLWIISFWTEVLVLAKVLKSWRKSVEWLKQQKRTKKADVHREAAEQCELMLRVLPWGVEKQGVSDNEPIHSLWRLLGPNWLSGSVMNDLLHLLRSEADNDATFQFEGTALTQKVCEAFKPPKDDEYHQDTKFRWLRTVGEDMVRNNKLILTYAHINENHWGLVIIDPKQRCIHLGDSLGIENVPNNIKNAYLRWSKALTQTEFTIQALDIGRQTDSVSCGIFAHLGAACFLLPTKHGATEHRNIERARMTLFTQIAGCILQLVSLSKLAP